MGQWKFHTPNGVTDLGPATCRSKRKIEQQLRQMFSLRGYQEVETSAMEFYDVYAADYGAVPQEELIKFFDEQGRILCLRYDGTVPVARMAATVLRDEPLPLRLSYIGNMYRYKEFGGGRQREFSQAGIELIGDPTPEADAEIIATAIAAARECGIEDLQISIGQVAFFKALLEQWQVGEEAAALLPQLINNKEMVALEEVFTRLALPDNARRILVQLASGYETDDVLAELDEQVDSPAALAALQNLRDVLAILADYGYQKYVTVDLGMLQSLNYYSGIIFKGFTYGLGFPLFSGGRYDQLVSAYGRDLAATGFSIGINFLLSALSRQNLLSDEPDKTAIIGYRHSAQKRVFQQADVLRRQGYPVSCQKTDQDQTLFFTSQPDQSQILLTYLDDNGTLHWKGEKPWNG